MARTTVNMLVDEYCLTGQNCVAGTLVCLADSSLLQNKTGKHWRFHNEALNIVLYKKNPPTSPPSPLY
jgi:hypothetical protein